MGAVIEIREFTAPGRLRVSYATGASEHRVGFTAHYWQAARFDADVVEEQRQFYESLLDDPDVEVAVVD